MGDENPIRTLGDYSKPSHEGYMNTIELPVGNNMVPLRSDTIRLVQNGCSFHGLRSEDPNQHLKDFLKLVDSLDLDGENRERTRLRLFQFSLRDQASNWLERLPAGSITTWEDLTTRFLAQFFPPGRTAKLRNDILMFQQHHGESLSEAWTRFKDLLQKVPHHGIDLWLQVQIFYDHVNPVTRRTIDQSAGGKLRDRNAKESWALLEDLALYDNESWNDPRDFAKPVKAITLPQDVPSTSDRRLIELENQVQRLMEAHLALTQPTQVNKITTSCEICSGPHDTQYCMEDPEQAFVEYASSCTDEAGGLVSNFMASQDARLSKFEADFKQQQSEMTNKIDTPGCLGQSGWLSKPEGCSEDEEFGNLFFKGLIVHLLMNGEIMMSVYDTDIEDVIEEEEGFVRKGGFGRQDCKKHGRRCNLVDVSIFIGKKYQEGYLKAKPMDDNFALINSSKFEADFKQQQSEMTNKIDTVLKAITDQIAKALPSNTVKNPKLSTSPVLSARSYPTKDPQCSTHIHGSINAITIHPKQQSKSHDDKPEENEEEYKDNPENIHVNPSVKTDPSVSFITEKVLKLNSFFESLRLVPQSSNIELVCPKGDDDDVIFIEIVKTNSHKEEPEVGEQKVEYFDIFLTRSKLAYHKYLMCGPIPSIFLRNPIITKG
ncbi:MAK10-like protein [Tanacetum coccineum]